jgi:threonine dehydrogenase-like Zn-dependent dehydrogenase
LQNRPVPSASHDEALIRVTSVGICGTDIEIRKGYMQFEGVPGHEFVGLVEQSRDAGWVGKRVVGEINLSCGRCAACQSGRERHCPGRTVLGIAGKDGAFAEYLTLPVSNLHQVPDSVSDSQAVFVEPLAAAYRILEQVEIDPSSRVLVRGDGRLGQLCAHAIRTAGCEVAVLGKHRKKLDLLQRHGIATYTAGRADLPLYDIVVDASGNPEGLALAFTLVRPGGTVVLKSTYHGGAELTLAGVVIDEINIIGSRCGPFRPALQHLVDYPEITDGMVTAVYPITSIEEAFNHAAHNDAIKVLIAIKH